MFGDRVVAFYGEEGAHKLANHIHCDSFVLHKPKSCTYCDYNPGAQQYRLDHNINFTGEKNPNKLPDPAELERGDNCQLWGGNKPVPEGADPLDVYYGPGMASFLRELEKEEKEYQAAESKMLDEGAPDLLE